MLASLFGVVMGVDAAAGSIKVVIVRECLKAQMGGERSHGLMDSVVDSVVLMRDDTTLAHIHRQLHQRGHDWRIIACSKCTSLPARKTSIDGNGTSSETCAWTTTTILS